MAPISGLPSPVSGPKTYKFQQLQVYQLALDYVDAVYAVGRQLPESERFNLRSQLERAATSIVLNIAEGSTSQSDAEQHRFLGLALRSYIETVACLDLIERRGYLSPDNLRPVRELGHRLFVKLQAFRNRLVGQETEEEGGTLRSPVSRPRSKHIP
jgi:four helix bundle protein